MNKRILFFAPMLALSGFSSADADSAPVEEPLLASLTSEESAFYMGLGLGGSYVNNDDTNEEMSSFSAMIQAGWQYNQYIALEGRYSFGLNMDYDPGNTGNSSSDYNGDLSSWGVYVKPMYPIGDFKVYALLGYGGVTLERLANGDAYESGFQWGLGAGYDFNEQLSVFVDYVSLYDDTGFDYRAKSDDVDAYTWALGVTYKF